LNVPTAGVDDVGFSNQLAGAVASLHEANIKPEEIDYSSGEMMGAAFRSGNTIASALASQSLAERLMPTDGSRELSDDELIALTKKDGLHGMLDNFSDVTTEAQYVARKNDINRELQDRKILEASGFSGMAAQAVAGILDWPTVVPVGRAVQLTKVATGLGRTAAEAALASGVSAAGAEAMLQETQATRTGEESAMAIGSATVLGAVVGFGVHQVLGADVADKVIGRLDATRADAETGFEGAKSAGAAALSQAQQQIARGLEKDTRVPSLAFKSLKKLGDLPGFLGKALRTPRLELEEGATAAERTFIGQMTPNPSISVREAQGAVAANSDEFAAPVNVAGVKSEFDGNFNEAMHQSEALYKKNKAAYKNLDDFGDRVALAMVNGDTASDPVVQQVAKTFRERVLTPIYDRHVENGNFDAAMKPKNAISYFPLVHDAEAIRADKDNWLDFHETTHLRAIEEDYRQAKVEREGRKSDKADMKIAAEKAAASDTNIIQAEHVENMRSLKVDRTREVDAFEANKKAEELALREDTDAKLAEARDTYDEFKGGDLQKGEATRLKASYAREKTKIEKQHIRAQAKLAAKHKIARDKLLKKHDDKEAVAIAQRDDAAQKALDEATATLTKAKELSLTDGLNILKKLNTPEKRAVEAAKRAQAMYETVTGSKRFTLDHEIGGGSNYAKFRSNPSWHADLIARKWVKTNIFDIMEHYTREAGADAAIGSVFKKTVLVAGEDGAEKVSKTIGDLGLTEVHKAIGRQYDDLIGGVRSAEQEKIAGEIDRLTKSGKAKPGEIDALKAKALEAGAVRSKAEVALVNRRDRAIENVKMLHRFAKGQSFEDGSSQSFANAVEIVSAFNFDRLMGGTVFSSLTDPINIIIANGFGNTMKLGVMPLLKNFRGSFKNMDGDMRRLSRLMNSNAEVTHASTTLAMADIGNPYAKSTPAVTFARTSTKLFSKVSGITYWNSLLKQIASNTTQGRLIQNAVQGWQGLSKAERAWSLNLGLSEGSYARIRASFEGQAGAKWVEGTELPIGRFDEWGDKEIAGRFRAAINAESFNNVVAPHFSDKMALAGTPMGQLILQFRRFMLSNQMRIVGRNLQLARIDDAGAKRASVYGGLFGLVMMGAVVDATKHALGTTTITGGNVDLDHNAFDRIIQDWEKNPGSALYNSLDRSGVFGVAFEGSNMLEKLGLPNVRGGMSHLLRDENKEKGSARFQNRGAFESVFGPTAGLFEDTMKFGSFVTGLGDQYLGSGEAPNFNRSDFRKAKRLIPFATAPGLQQLMNEGEAYMGTVFDWPEPK